MRRVVAVLALLLLGCSSKPQVVHDYDHVPVPAVPERTLSVAASDALPDGMYWAASVRITRASGTDTIELRITQAAFGPSCEQAGGTDCANGYAAVLEPHRDITSSPSDLRSASVAAESRQNFAVTPPEWVRLVRGEAPSSMAPAEYRYAHYPYLVTIVNGSVVELRQVWVPAVLEPQPGW